MKTTLTDWALDKKNKYPALKYPLFGLVVLIALPLTIISFLLIEMGYLGEALENWLDFDD